MTDIDKSVGELLPCPFCGGTPSLRRMDDESIWSHDIVQKTSVTCAECDVSTEFTEEGQDPESIELWNRRAALQSAKPAGEAGDGNPLGDEPLAYGTISDLAEARIAADLARRDALMGLYPSACVVLDMALSRLFHAHDNQTARIADLEQALDSAYYRAGMAEASAAMLKGNANAFMQQAQEAGAELEKSERKIIGLGVLAMKSVPYEAYAARADQITELKYERDEARRQLAEVQKELDEWRFTNRVDELGRHADKMSEECAELRRQLAEAQATIKSLSSIVAVENDGLRLKCAAEILDAAEDAALSSAIAEVVEPYKRDAERLRGALGRLLTSHKALLRDCKLTPSEPCAEAEAALAKKGGEK